MGRGKPKVKQQPINEHPKPNETSLRISFLQQAAKLMAEKKLAEVRNIQQTFLSKDFRRSFCRCCNRIWIPNKNGENGIEVKMSKDRIYRKCTDCNSIASFVRNPKYRSRNEKS
uniref:Recombination activating protein 1 n=1 Tax=Panagrolaimus sp. PS1159 TaxID=55785 RepID=A0AC35FTS0_9BILA